MASTVLCLFNAKGGIGRTTLVYHLAWMFSDLDVPVVAADLDPQANLTAAFLGEGGLEELWGQREPSTISDSLQPLLDGTGDVARPELRLIEDSRIALLPGDLSLLSFEEELSIQWPRCLVGDVRAFRITSALWRLSQLAAETFGAPLVIADLGSNLGSINRSALIGSDYLVVPLASDAPSLRGMRHLGSTLREWRRQWQERLAMNPEPELRLPVGRIEPAGYVVVLGPARLDRPAQAAGRWIERIPRAYAEALGDEAGPVAARPEDDPSCLALLKHYRSLLPMAQEARKPMFHLKPADGAIGSHFTAVQQARGQFERLARGIARRIGLELPSSPAVTGMR